MRLEPTVACITLSSLPVMPFSPSVTVMQVRKEVGNRLNHSLQVYKMLYPTGKPVCPYLH